MRDGGEVNVRVRVKCSREPNTSSRNLSYTTVLKKDYKSTNPEEDGFPFETGFESAASSLSITDQDLHPDFWGSMCLCC